GERGQEHERPRGSAVRGRRSVSSTAACRRATRRGVTATTDSGARLGGAREIGGRTEDAIGGSPDARAHLVISVARGNGLGDAQREDGRVAIAQPTEAVGRA